MALRRYFISLAVLKSCSRSPKATFSVGRFYDLGAVLLYRNRFSVGRRCDHSKFVVAKPIH